MGVELPATVTLVTPNDMLIAITSAWRGQLGGYPTQPQVCVLVAQWALECAGGHKMIAFNVGNAKRPDPNAGDYCYFTTTEIIGGKPVVLHPPNPGCRFAAYHSLEQGCEAYLHAQYTRWVAAWPSVVAGDPVAYARALGKAGYYTASPEVYASGCLSWFVSLMNKPWTSPPENRLADCPPIPSDVEPDDPKENA